MSYGSYFVSLSTLVLAYCANRLSLESAGSDTGGAAVAGLGADMEVASTEEVSGIDEVAGVAETDEARGRISDCSGGSSTTISEESLCLVMSIS